MRMLPAALLASATLLASAAPAIAAVDVSVVAVPGSAPRGLLAPDRHSVLFSDDCGVVWRAAAGRTTPVAGTASCAALPTLAPPAYGDATAPGGAQLSGLVGLGHGARDDLLLADAGYHRIRLLSSDGIRTLAGSGTGLADGGFADGPGQAARFDQPSAAEGLPDGSVVVADSGNGRVRRIAAGRVTTIAGGGDRAPGDGVPATDARLGMVADVAVQGRAVAFTDATSGAVWRIAADGTLRRVAAGLTLPFGLDVRGGELVVAQLGAGRVTAIAPDGATRTLATGLDLPFAVAVAPCTGDVLVDEFSAGRILRLHEGTDQGCRFPPGRSSP